MRQIFQDTKDIKHDKTYLCINSKLGYFFLYNKVNNVYTFRDLDTDGRTKLRDATFQDFRHFKKDILFQTVVDGEEKGIQTSYATYEFDTEEEALKYVTKHKMMLELMK